MKAVLPWMASFTIKGNKDLLRYLEVLQKKTLDYMNSDSRGFDDLESDDVDIIADFTIGDEVAKRIEGHLTYFKGTINANGHTITNGSTIQFSLFSSCYMATVNDLTIHNQKGSLGMTFALDVSRSEFNNYVLSGELTIPKTTGGIAKTSHYNKFNNCKVHLNTISRPSTMSINEEGSELVQFGAYVSTELGNSVYTNCSVRGNITSENNVSGFCSTANGATFIKCNINNLKLLGKRNVGLFVGNATKPISLIDCSIDDSELSGVIYLGCVVGSTTSEVNCENLIITDTLVNPDFVSSFIGGITGSADKINITKSSILCSVSGSFIIAALCPDAREGILTDSLVEVTVTASGYSPMMTHAYKLFRDEDLTSHGKEIKIFESGNEVKVDLIELGMGGYINPFGKVIR